MLEPTSKDGRERAANSLYPGLTDWIGVGSMGRYYPLAPHASAFWVVA